MNSSLSNSTTISFILLSILIVFVQYSEQYVLDKRSAIPIPAYDQRLADMLSIHEYNFDTRDAEARKRSRTHKRSTPEGMKSGGISTYNENVRKNHPIADPERG